MQITMMRAISALAVACLLAASATAPARADEPDARRAVAELVDRHPALPALAAARHATLIVVRPDAAAPDLPVAVLAAAPSLPPRIARPVVVAPHRAHTPGSNSVPTRSARGPPVC